MYWLYYKRITRYDVKLLYLFWLFDNKIYYNFLILRLIHPRYKTMKKRLIHPRYKTMKKKRLIRPRYKTMKKRLIHPRYKMMIWYDVKLCILFLIILKQKFIIIIFFFFFKTNKSETSTSAINKLSTVSNFKEWSAICIFYFDFILGKNSWILTLWLL
jgi:hypothetical protein